MIIRIAILLVLLLASPADAKWIIVDETGTVQDIASHKGNLSRGYQFAKPQVYEVKNDLAVNILDKYDGKKVTRYSGTEAERRAVLLDYAIRQIEQKLTEPLPSAARDEWTTVLEDLNGLKE